MGFQTVLVERRGAVELVTMNRPEVRNAQNTQLLTELDEALRAADANPDVNVIVIAGSGPHFSAGHDLKAYVGEAPSDEWHEKRKTPEGKFEHERQMYFDKALAIRDLHTPTIAMVQGKCIAGGLMVACMCDLIVAADDAVFQNPVLAMSGAGVEVLAEFFDLGARKTKEFLWTGAEIGAEEAARLGWINHVVPRAQLETETMALAERISRLPAVTVQNVKRSVNHAMDLAGFRSALEYHFMVHQFQHNTKTSLDMLAARQQKKSMKEVFEERDQKYFEG
ncbi:MAG: enoyl-CoA hydratase [Actinobacteria bacterium]|nr:enoyl-CoA hydratase [Actinomycetota bacterium]